MNVHFICLGNTFRSRLAEAYLKSRMIPDMVVTSSGMEAEGNLNGPLCWYTRDILFSEHLSSFNKAAWTQTMMKSIEGQDLLIFLHASVFTIFKKTFGTPTQPFEVWDIEDAPPGWDSLERDGASAEEKDNALAGAFAKYRRIVSRVDELVKRLAL